MFGSHWFSMTIHKCRRCQALIFILKDLSINLGMTASANPVWTGFVLALISESVIPLFTCGSGIVPLSCSNAHGSCGVVGVDTSWLRSGEKMFATFPSSSATQLCGFFIVGKQLSLTNPLTWKGGTFNAHLMGLQASLSNNIFYFSCCLVLQACGVKRSVVAPVSFRIPSLLWLARSHTPEHSIANTNRAAVLSSYVPI